MGSRDATLFHVCLQIPGKAFALGVLGEIRSSEVVVFQVH